MNVRTRFAPSPTGTLHIGVARTAIFNWLFAKRNSGKFYLRIEDTDRERSKDEYVESIKHGLNWLGLNWDGNIVFQSQRVERHKEVAQALIDKGVAYHCYATQEEIQNFRDANPGQKFISKWRDGAQYYGSSLPVVRLRINDDGITKINDLVLGEIEVKNGEMDDMVLLRSDKTPTYLLSCVVDDYDMQISHIIRGNDHLTNTFRQLQILKAIGWKEPSYVHIPLIHGNDGRKISKRDGGAGLEEYRERGYLPEALFNYLLRLGWGHENREIINAQEAIQIFNLADISKSPARFDLDKLNFINQYYIRSLDDEVIFAKIINQVNKELLNEKCLEKIKKSISLIKSRGQTINDLVDLVSIFISYSNPIDEQSKEILALNESKQILVNILDTFKDEQNWNADMLKQLCSNFAAKYEIKIAVIMKALRAGVLGTFKSPPIYETLEILGKEETMHRISQIID